MKYAAQYLTAFGFLCSLAACGYEAYKEDRPQPASSPQVVITKIEAPCKERAIVSEGYFVWLCADGDAYETRIR